MSEITLGLSGGGARGAYHLGVLHFIEQEGLHVKAISATSIGAVIGASWLSGVRAKEQLQIFKSKEFKDIFSFNSFKKSLYKIDTNAKILEQLVPTKNIQDLSTPFNITALDLISGENLCFNNGDIKTLCIASCALVPVFEPVDYNDYKLADGGFANHIPLEPLGAYDAIKVGVNLHPIYKKESNNNIFSHISRTLYLSMYKESFRAKNSCDIHITTEKLLDYSMFSFKNFDLLFALGYQNAQEKFNLKL